MLSKNKLKYVRSLALKKNRDAEGVFLAEGPKIVGDLANRFPCQLLLGTAEYLGRKCNDRPQAEELVEVTQGELEQASQLRSPRDVLAVFSRKKTGETAVTGGNFDGKALAKELFSSERDAHKLVLALDDVQDPGNLGTIIRLADWFGIEDIVCSSHTADAFAPKVVQATMGAIARVCLRYTDLPTFLGELSEKVPVYGTFLNGNNIYDEQLRRGGVLVMGNEGAGISPETEHHVTHRLFIPSFPPSRVTSESLNVAVATAIACAEFRRQTLRLQAP